MEKKNVLKIFLEVLNVDFVSLLTSFYEGKRKSPKEKSLLLFLAGGECNGKKTPSSSIMMLGELLLDHSLRLSPPPQQNLLSLGPVPKLPHL